MSLTSYSTGEDGVALLRLERPEARNAINTQMLDEILAHLAAAREDEAVLALVLSSSDHMGFSEGADVREQLDERGMARLREALAHFPGKTEVHLWLRVDDFDCKLALGPKYKVTPCREFWKEIEAL